MLNLISATCTVETVYWVYICPKENYPTCYIWFYPINNTISTLNNNIPITNLPYMQIYPINSWYCNCFHNPTVPQNTLSFVNITLHLPGQKRCTSWYPNIVHIVRRYRSFDHILQFQEKTGPYRKTLHAFLNQINILKNILEMKK